ncbi:MAG: 8-amino-7-oxononanoate synthase [Proteobacteria bacterium]|nr:8-amino-7-oxononanoate synthase [Pseudomonadota bacterium]
MLNNLNNRLKKALDERKQQHRYRSRRISEGPQQVEMQIDDKDIISFSSNDYLGLANHPQIKQAMIDGVKNYGVGSGAAHLVNGHSRAHHLLEEELAEFTGYPRALLFSTGYMANLGVCQALLDKNDFVFEDRLNHASLIDGGLLSGARFQRYLHNDVSSLQKKLDKAAGTVTDKQHTKLVLTDGVFSMDGDIADLPPLSDLCNKTASWLMVDDAHGFGTLGRTGRGSLQHYSLDHNDVPIYMATLGKAIGTAGAFIAGSDELIETIIQQARTYIYTTAMPAAIAEATRCSLKLIQNETVHLDKLNHNIHYFRKCCDEASLSIENSQTAIQPLLIGDDENAMSISHLLFEQGFLVTAIRPPTVPEGTSRLRITLSAKHQKAHIDKLIETLSSMIETDT